MKRIISILVMFLVLSCFARTKASPSGRDNDSVTVFSTPALFDLATKWAVQYNTSQRPGKMIKVVSVPGERIEESLGRHGTMSLVRGKDFKGLNDDAFWKLTVARDIVVPVINAGNPFVNEINKQGVSPEELKSFLIDGSARSWSSLLENEGSNPAHLYFLEDESVSEVIEAMAGSGKIAEATGFKNPADLISAIQKDPLSVGICKLVSLTAPGVTSDGIMIMPVDRNSNGRLDYNENIYSDLNSFERGIWIGKYPRTFFSNIYSVTYGNPDNVDAQAFMKWILEDGQQYLYSNGFSGLLAAERQTGIDRLAEALIVPAASEAGGQSIFKSFIFLLVILVLGWIIIAMIMAAVRRSQAALNSVPKIRTALDPEALILPKGILFDKTHSWAFLEQDGLVRIGVDDFLQHLTGAISRVKMKNAGDAVKKGEEILTIIQNGKRLVLYSPVSGIIREKNPALEGDASFINSSPYDKGWICRMEPLNWARENQLLFMADKQKQFIRDEILRLKDFLVSLAGTENSKYAPVILQDGGMFADNILENMGPEVWEEFQSRFIDPSRQIWFYELY